MADEDPIHKRPCGIDVAEELAMVERTAMTFVLDEFPARCTIEEISLALNQGKPDFRGEDEVRIAIRELTAAGLLHDEDGFVSPTRAARRFAALGVE
jgi:hypothetical protein